MGKLYAFLGLYRLGKLAWVFFFFVVVFHGPSYAICFIVGWALGLFREVILDFGRQELKKALGEEVG